MDFLDTSLAGRVFSVCPTLSNLYLKGQTREERMKKAETVAEVCVLVMSAFWPLDNHDDSVDDRDNSFLSSFSDLANIYDIDEINLGPIAVSGPLTREAGYYWNRLRFYKWIESLKRNVSTLKLEVIEACKQADAAQVKQEELEAQVNAENEDLRNKVRAGDRLVKDLEDQAMSNNEYM
jgi:hypothetical protein